MKLKKNLRALKKTWSPLECALDSVMASSPRDDGSLDGASQRIYARSAANSWSQHGGLETVPAKVPMTNSFLSAKGQPKENPWQKSVFQTACCFVFMHVSNVLVELNQRFAERAAMSQPLSVHQHLCTFSTTAVDRHRCVLSRPRMRQLSRPLYAVQFFSRQSQRSHLDSPPRVTDCTFLGGRIIAESS